MGTKNKRFRKRYRRFVFTLNNPTEHEFGAVEAFLQNCQFWVFQKEEGKAGTHHLQGYFEYKNPKEWDSLRKKLRWHLEPARGSRFQSWNYCTKVSTRIEGPWFSERLSEILEDPLQGKELYPWEVELNTILSSPPEQRKIYWYWDKRGNTGKTTFMRSYRLRHEDCLVISGKSSDVKFAFFKRGEEKTWPRTVFYNVSRSLEKFVSYEVLETLKDGVGFSGKYESQDGVWPIPHVIVFANFEPDYACLSNDRWRVVNLD